MSAAATRCAPVFALGGLFLAAVPMRAADVKLPDGGLVKKVDFERHVMGLFGRTGCNNGSCHGSFQGKGGFRLSLFGYDPDKDFHAIDPRRPRPAHQPGRSRSQPAPAQGDRPGRAWRRASGSARIPGQYQPDPRMDRAGRPWHEGQRRGRRRHRHPAGVRLQQDRARRPADRQGPLRRRLRGKHHAVLRLPHQRRRHRRGQRRSARSRRCSPATRRSSSPTAATCCRCACWCRCSCRRASRIPTFPKVNFVDREGVRQAAPAQHGAVRPVERRRVPAPRHHRHHRHACRPPDEVRAFLADQRPEQASERRSTNCWPIRCTPPCGRPSSATSPATTPTPWRTRSSCRPKRSQMWHDWFRKRVAENMPYDEIVRGVLTATSRDGRSRSEWIEAGQARSTRRRRPASTPPYAERRDRSICSGGGSRRCRSNSGARRRRRRSSASASNAPSATSIRSTAGRRPTTAPTPTSSRR